VEIKIIEEWGFNIGEDACLFEDDGEQNSQSDFAEVQGDPEAAKNVDSLVDKLVKDLEEEVVYSDTEARDVVKKDDVAEAAIPASVSDVGSQVQPEKFVDMAQSHSSLGAAVMRPVGSEGDGISDVGNVMQDVGITLEGSQSNNVNNSDEELGKQKVAQKEGSDHVPVLTCPPFGGKSAMSGPWSM